MDESNGVFTEEETHKVFQTDHIVQHFLRFLDLEAVKSCRLVNKQWKSLSNKFMRSKSRVVFNFEKKTDGEMQEIEDEMMRINQFNMMENSKVLHTPFSEFIFEGYVPMPIFVTFLTKFSCCIEMLKLRGPITDITDLNREIPKYDLGSIRYIQDLKLENCCIILDEIIRIKPAKLYLGDTTTFKRNGVEINKFILTDAFDLSQTSKLFIGNKAVVLDFGLCADTIDKDSPKISREVSLKNAKTRTWSSCNWNLTHFTLDNVPFIVFRNQMEIQKLRLENTIADMGSIYKRLNLTSLELEGGVTFTSNIAFYLQNLTQLSLRNDSLALLPYFSQHYNLKRLKLSNDHSYEIDTAYLPNNLKRLTLINVAVKGNKIFKVENLYLINYKCPGQYLTIIKAFKAIIINDLDFDILKCSVNLRAVIKNPKFCHYLILGIFKWNEVDFEASLISKFVEEKAELYWFEGIPSPKTTAFKRYMFYYDNARGMAVNRDKYIETSNIQLPE